MSFKGKRRAALVGGIKIRRVQKKYDCWACCLQLALCPRDVLAPLHFSVHGLVDLMETTGVSFLFSLRMISAGGLSEPWL
jgi:hypothetical protein